MVLRDQESSKSSENKIKIFYSMLITFAIEAFIVYDMLEIPFSFTMKAT